MLKQGKPGKYGHNKGRNKYDSGKNPKNHRVPQQKGEPWEETDINSPTIQQFAKYAESLKKKQEISNVIFQFSRDVTNKIRNIISSLHSIENGHRSKEDVLEAVERDLENLVSVNYYSIATKLRGEDCYLYLRAFSNGLQEFIKAYTLFEYIRSGQFHQLETYQKKLTYEIGKPSETEKIRVYIAPTDFIFGLAEISGELLKMCLNNQTSQNMEMCCNTRDVIRKLYLGFQSIGPSRNHEMKNKEYTLRQNLLKIENMCYNNKISKKVPAEVIAQEEYPDEDEGFYN